MNMTRFLALTPIFAGLLTSALANPSSSSAGLLLVANKGDQTLGLIDSDAGRQIATVAEGGVTGHEVAASPDGKRAFVPIYGNSGVGMHLSVSQGLRRVVVAAAASFGRADCRWLKPRRASSFIEEAV
jgi:hypothetical protein